MEFGTEPGIITNSPNTPIANAPSFSDLESFEVTNDHLRYFELSYKIPNFLKLSNSLYFVFCAWKLNRLSELDIFSPQSLKSLNSNEYEIFTQFLKAHQLRIEGKIREGFQILEDLQKVSPSWIIQFRFAAEAIAFYDLPTAMTLIEKIILQIPDYAKKVLYFNLGVASINKNALTYYRNIERHFSEDLNPLSQFFFFWLRGGFFQHTMKSAQSVNFYTQALNLVESLPDRETDRPILAFLLLRQSLWTGDLEASRRAMREIEYSENKQNNLSLSGRSLAKALHELNEGNLSEAQLRIETLFDDFEGNHDHLKAGEFFLWILISHRNSLKGMQTLKILNETIDKLGFGFDKIEYEIFSLYFNFLNGTISNNEFQKNALPIIDNLKSKGLERAYQTAQFLYHLHLEDSYEQRKAFNFVTEMMFVQRIGVSILTNSFLIPSTFRNIKPLLSDSIAKIMLDLHLSRVTSDLLLFAQSVKSLSDKRASAWASILNIGKSDFTIELGRLILNSELLLDHDARRVIAIENFETLDSQPLLSELMFVLYQYPFGLTKEIATLNLGYSDYDPLQHDPIIYNLIARLRDWLRKQGICISINLVRQGWTLTHRDLIRWVSSDLNDSKKLNFQDLSFQDFNSDTSNKINLTPSNLSPRLEWIMTIIENRGHISRTDLMKRFSIKKSTAANDFNDLIKKELILRQGQGRGIYYTKKRSTNV